VIAIQTVNTTALLDELLEIIQLTPSQHKLAEERYIKIGKWLSAKDSILAKFDPIIYPQGSLLIGTTVKPIFQNEFDLDLVLELRAADCRDFSNPVALLDMVEFRIKQHPDYSKMYERKNRCIRICYANDFHLDILPACPDRQLGGTCLLVPDREANAWKPSNPKGYAAWFENQALREKVGMKKEIEPLPDQENVENKPPLKLSTQLMKRDRDVRYVKTPKQAPISIVLTTLAGYHYKGEESVSQALMIILNGIVAGLPHNDRLRVHNPSNPKEDLSERWDDDRDAYALFVRSIKTFQQQWQKLLSLRGIPEITELLEQLFGEELAKTAVKEHTLRRNTQRSDGKLGITPTGIIITTNIPGSVPIKTNTFYGA
jgi:hypothetical protein